MARIKNSITAKKKSTVRKSEAVKMARKVISKQKAGLSKRSYEATELAKAIKKLGKDYDNLVVKFSIVDVKQTVMAKCNCICFA